MGLLPPFLSGGSRKKRAQIISVDLGSRTTKAVLLERRGERLALSRYALLDAPISDKKISPEQLADHLRAVAEALGNSTKFITAAIGLGESVARIVELPLIPVDEMRTILKMSHKNYLQQDLPNHAFDCCILPPRISSATSPASEGVRLGAQSKVKVLAAATKQQMVND